MGEQSVLRGSMAGAMMTNSIEMGLWSGIQSGTNAHILQGKSMASEKVVAEHEANTHGVGAVFGEYDNWITRKAENSQKIKAAEAAIAAAKKQEAKDLEGTREGVLHDTKDKIANDIAHIKNAKKIKSVKNGKSS